MSLRRVSAFVVVAVVLVAAGTVAAVYWSLSRHAAADRTGWAIWVLSKVLVSEQLEAPDPELLASLLGSNIEPSDVLQDGWGRPLHVKISTTPDGQYRARVWSLGGDGQPGPCFVGFPPCSTAVGDWLTENGEYLNQW